MVLMVAGGFFIDMQSNSVTKKMSVLIEGT